MQHCNITYSNGIANCSNSDINCLYFNARSLKKNFSLIEDFISKSPITYHVITVTETWLFSNETNFYNLKNYHAFHSTRDISRGGGVAIYVLKNFDGANEIGNKYFNGNNCLVVELLKEKKNICVIYRQPNSPTDPTGTLFIDEFNDFLSKFNNAFIFGDFNLNIFDSSRVTEKYKDGVTLNNFMFMNSFSRDFPTRINYSNYTSTCIDHVITDQFDNPLFDKFHLSYFDLVADHKALCLSIWKNGNNNSSDINKTPNTHLIINHRKISQDKLIENLNSANLNELVNDLKKIIDSNTIVITKCNKIKKPYISQEIYKLIKVKQNYEKLKLSYPKSTYVHEKWKFYRNKVSSVCSKAKKKFLDSYFYKNGSNSRKTWNQLNNTLGKSPKRDNSSILKLIDNGLTITDKKLIANTLNSYQVDISNTVGINKSIDENTLKNYHNNKIVNIKVPFTCPECTEDEVINIINNLKNSNSLDIYGMSNMFIKIHKNEITPIITKLINMHMLNGDFPDSLKIAIVKPIYKKKGSKLDKRNYRPISGLPIISKIFESVMYRRISDHCNENKLLNIDQFGYQAKSGTETAMLHTMNDIYRCMDKKLVTALLTIDLSNAFDCLNHEILIIKLRKMRFPNFFMNLIESYFINRYQYVKVDDILSHIKRIYCGAPQGGVLSGLFFNIYVNSIFDLLLSNKLRLYCDDMSLIAYGVDKDELKRKLEHDLLLINTWLDFHRLKANFNKTNYVLFCGRKKFEPFTDRALDIKINDSLIERVDHVKIVGLYIDEQLNFSYHIDYIKKKINPFVAKFFHIRRFISEKTALNLYYAHVYSHLIFMNSIWSVAPNYLIESLGVIQRRALRIVYRKDRLCHSVELFDENVLPLSAVIIMHENLVLFKMLKNLLKNNIPLITANDMHSHNTRRNHHLILYHTSTAIGQNNFYFRAIRSFNALPDYVKKFNSIGLFKTRLKEHLANSVAI